MWYTWWWCNGNNNKNKIVYNLFYARTERRRRRKTLYWLFQIQRGTSNVCLRVCVWIFISLKISRILLFYFSHTQTQTLYTYIHSLCFDWMFFSCRFFLLISSLARTFSRSCLVFAFRLIVCHFTYNIEFFLHHTFGVFDFHNGLYRMQIINFNYAKKCRKIR